ncbi:MAG TPA: glycosyltransferase [Candidatus Angelobacter sp.]|nr:glycosyltransferase [Candidatus Angelobacter sp.]
MIPAKNERKLLPLLLESLCRQDYPCLPDTTVCIADAGSTDGTVELALSYSDRLKIKIIRGGLPSVGRNAGARQADTPYVLFLDADIELASTSLLRRAMEKMKRRRLHCLTTNIWCRDGNWRDRSLYFGNNIVQFVSGFGQPFSTGMFMLFDKRKFDQLGGFNERALFAEDYLLSRQVSPRRFSIVGGGALTSNRRFQKIGHMRMIYMFMKTALNTFNEKHFLRDHNWWQTEHESPKVVQ